MSALFDLHCDTLTCNGWPPYEDVTETLDTPAFQLALSKVPAGTRWVQCFAIFVPDEVRGEDAAAFFERHAASFRRQAERHRDRMACSLWRAARPWREGWSGYRPSAMPGCG